MMSKPHHATLESIKYTPGSLRLLDQRKLPLETVFDDVLTVEDIWSAINEMRVRGAPAIAVSAALGIAVATQRKVANGELKSGSEVQAFFLSSCDFVMTSRPTAVNLFNCLRDLKEQVEKLDPTKAAAEVAQACVELAEAVYTKDVAFNEGIMRHGAAHILAVAKAEGRDKVSILTICNTGALATSRYGTALGVVRQLFYDGKLERVYACETRPWNQGARLTVYECVQEGIPCTLICDGAASSLMLNRKIDAVVVGADRICQNGDTANKIGTYNLAVSAKFHGVKLYVAAPSTTLDAKTASGNRVEIEEREPTEITTNMVTKQRVVADGPHLSVWNPVFDITPGELITGGIITEKGVQAPTASAPYYDIASIIAQP
ncbi:translation initiation factor 2 subunit [Leishmania donovani]|uniref:Methylthioribose-1-phosphate isomerase n=3 Tax=Leishmania donovani species complex TaxID=38574 RepID=MTNA_LEIIN|nr:putative translation initiation factor 2 subunit [Leishmania infantum JPCM5]XP_003865630.1 translation initiation factor 2 subunit, putative [Leishmania donovani]A4ICE5.1 RecName: Full=Methylthioribose-1-phosphate isomerase; Short=M1Pi; Short=MTR-1-P isomerase; AltName: Full=S-methyl-5-thioribose-1-phosphate isomerase; AltName: Full=Translation initiation factor eIF-2B subunit alpha/beta/delta-like protein [Leishmania infantum]CAJ1993890.1 translation initiation factor 2 subunit [Leishmania d|eukprot:XP_001469414.1 putative translation initiation factor 2 subunit [Leishmania infantum JPCM5]